MTGRHSGDRVVAGESPEDGADGPVSRRMATSGPMPGSWRQRSWPGPPDRENRDGPLLIEEYDTVTVVPPGCTARRDDRGNIVIEVRP